MENEKSNLENRQDKAQESNRKRVDFLNSQISKFEEDIKKFQYELSLLDLNDEQSVDIDRLIKWAKDAKRECEKSLETIEVQNKSGDSRN